MISRNHWKRVLQTIKNNSLEQGLGHVFTETTYRAFAIPRGLFYDIWEFRAGHFKRCKIPLEGWQKSKVTGNWESAILLGEFGVPGCPGPRIP